jgi:hypothetical protein
MGRQSTLEKKAPVVRPGLRDDCLGGALNAPLGTKLGSGNADPPMRHKSSNASVSVTARRFESAGDLRDASSLRGRDSRVVGAFGVANLACDLGDRRAPLRSPVIGFDRPEQLPMHCMIRCN